MENSTSLNGRGDMRLLVPRPWFKSWQEYQDLDVSNWDVVVVVDWLANGLVIKISWVQVLLTPKE